QQVHVASLIHDDLPCMDYNSIRRGQPSNHNIYRVDMAVLAGDVLFPLGIQHIVSHTPAGLMAGAQDDEIQRLRRYGRAVGVLHQVDDDILQEGMRESEENED
ncbi:polyprenyl_synt domain-containing protein, partial [Cephalotus follicularis]